jgi:hypothetical protein
MEDQLVLPETAIIADSKGFEGEVTHWYQPRYDSKYKCYRFGDDHLLDSCRDKDDILAPTQSLLARWLREKHRIEVFVIPYSGGYSNNLCNTINNQPQVFKTYELALEAGLQEGLKLI